ncbi:hypothetical protein [Mediterraneibacter gnavus]|uniref:hypothetical protein n=1 Tax=Mediterraneibacter gnavus TaxID=33038 RepID=UPI0036D439D7
MENERGRQEVLMALQGVGRLGIMMDPVFKLTAAGTILLIQHFARMYKEGLLNRREFQNFQEFAKLTEGNYQIINIPVGSWKELEKTGFVHQMEERGVRYVELPDLNQTDGLVQVAIYGEDQLKFQAWYDRFLMAEMKGGEHELLWSSIFVTLMANKIGGLQFGIYRNCQISSRVFHTAVAALPLTKANRSDFE